MKIRFDIDVWEEILITITRNKTRSLLTAFGVFWGIFMLLALLGGGEGLKALMGQNFKGFATNSSIFWAQSTTIAYKGFPEGRQIRLTTDDIGIIEKNEGVKFATPVVGRYGSTFKYEGKSSQRGSIRGTEPIYTDEVEEMALKFGRRINQIDQEKSRKVCVLGHDVYTDLFHDGFDPCGKYVECDGVYYQVVGVADKTSSNINIGGGRAGSRVTIPLSTVQMVYNLAKDVDMYAVVAKPGYLMGDLEKGITQSLLRYHNASPKDEMAIRHFNAQAMFTMVDNVMTGISLLTILVGIGTLLAGIIGVSNIMMVTVKERTTEIGIRRAIGATPRIIMRQIMAESIVLTAIAGMFGLCLTVLVLQVAQVAISSSQNTLIPFQISFWTAVGTLFILAALGVGAGLAPAYRAMAIKPIEAIRDE